jgi:hypothetical protein
MAELGGAALAILIGWMLSVVSVRLRRSMFGW